MLATLELAGILIRRGREEEGGEVERCVNDKEILFPSRIFLRVNNELKEGMR